MTTNILYAQSGGVTAVINASACAVIETARQCPERIGTVFGARNGILGALHGNLVDTQHASDAQVASLRHSPGGVFGSCRHKLPDPADDTATYDQLFRVLDAHNIGIFLYNGGNDSADTAEKIARAARQRHSPLRCLGIPKTVDNDLPETDFSPGFGSVAKYVAVSTLEASLDVRAMCATSTKVFIFEVMGRHAGWIAAAGALARRRDSDAPHIILLPETPFNQDAFLAKVQRTLDAQDYCVIVASEGVQDGSEPLATQGGTDAFGHKQLGGVAPHLAGLITSTLKVKTHYAVADYLQRSARHVASATDMQQAYAVGQAAVDYALQGMSAVMPGLVRDGNRWRTQPVDLRQIANREKKVPPEYIAADGMDVTAACVRYLRPLIQGEAPVPYADGVPRYLEFPLVPVPAVSPSSLSPR